MPTVMAEIAIALLMFVLIALLAVIMLDAQHPESQLLRALRGWQSGISMLFGFADLIVANQLQYENSIRLKVIEARVDERNIALALYADVTAQEAFLVGMRWHEDVVSNLAEQMKPKGGWASNAQDREIFCGLVKTHYIGIRVPDLGLFERLKSELGKLAPATVQGYLADNAT